MSIILFTTRPITSKYTKSLIEQMHILKEYQEAGENIIFVTPKTDPRNAKYIEEVAGITISQTISYIDHYENTVFTKKYKTWNEYLDHEFIFENLKDAKAIVMFGGLLSDATAITREKNGLNKLLGTWQQMNFRANGTYMTGALQLINLSRKYDIPFHEICYDPCENSIDQLSYKPHTYYCYHGYDWPEYNLNRLDSLQSYILNIPKPASLFTDDEKEIDICFGFTALTKAREIQYEKATNSLNELKNAKTKIFLRNKSLNIDTFVPRDEYLDNIKKSRYTLIIQPYDINHFSIYRFIESIHNDCLPLIIKDVNIADFMKSFNIDKQIYERIAVEYDEIGNRINDISEEERTALLNYFKEKCLVNNKKLKIEVAQCI